MHVGLNLIYLVPGETGGPEIYARELIPALRKVAPEVRLTSFVNREAAAVEAPWNELTETVVLPIEATNRVSWVRGEQLMLPRHAPRQGVDLVHSLANTGPTWGRFARVQTVLDLLYMMVPEAHFGLRGLGMRVLVPAAARRSHRVITISQSTRRDLIDRLHVPGEKIDVVPVGLGTRFAGRPLAEHELRRCLGLGDRTVALSVSTKRAHKNLMRLLEAHALIPSGERPLLVLPGYPTPHEDELRRRAGALGIEDDVLFLGWLPPEELEGLYAAAALFVFTSLYEGFGMTVLEAMARGVPVACGAASAVPEVAGDAALLFDPESPEQIAEAMRSLLRDGALRDRLAEAGRARAEQFSWERTARETVDSYRRALSEARPGRD
ncbi:MAG: glycosyltransferase family 4 protein [Solirubrobacterales bacterium]|nr:glycosyltransferase family 1 protein [Solirubrobacterales bacterium]